jgi:hypothetical protein
VRAEYHGASGETRRRSVGLSAGADQNSAWILNNKELCVAAAWATWGTKGGLLSK